ncbi:MAG: nicotinate (nicotinamide) nucleotide adenylyltransferase [Treponema sp.]|nr:nicotinate (nicotinamide) nucleotide adenylyltransferase [Treponema sp.]
MKIALFGGSFNPLHIGHAMLADTLVRELSYDKVLLIPTFIPPHKQLTNAASAEHRLGLTNAFCKNSSNFIAEPCEIERGGVSYTFDTLEYIIQKYKPDEKPGLIIGQENAAEFDKWKNAEKIASMADIIIAQRRESSGGVDSSSSKNVNIGSYTGGFENNKIIFPYKHHLLENLIIPLSSTEIRARIECGKSWRYLVPESVFRYIKDWQLYGYK